MPPRFGWYGNDGFWLPLVARLAPTCHGSIRSCGWRPACRRLSPRSSSTPSTSALAQEKPVDVSAAGIHDDAAELPGRHGRERRDADQPAAPPRRGRVPAPHRVRQRGQPAAGARHRAGARDGRPHVDRRRPPPASAAAADRERPAVPRRRCAGRAVRLCRHPARSSG